MAGIYWKKAESLEFERGCAALLKRLGATPADDCLDLYASAWVLDTPAGALRLSVDGVDRSPITGARDHCAALMGRFDNPKAAREMVDCNPFSGKWNHHYFPPGRMADILASLEGSLRRVLPKVPA